MFEKKMTNSILTQTSSNMSSFWPKLQFSLFLIGQIFSIPCYLFVFYHILFNKIARQSLHNHSILILLFYNFLNVIIDVSLLQNFTRLGYVSPFYPFFCLLWQFIDYGIWYGGISLMFWISIERHILVFHKNLIGTSRRRLIFHYIPIIISSLYAPILYFCLIFLIPCKRIYTIQSFHCGTLCFYSVVPNWFNLYDSFVNYIIPILLIVVFSFSLIIRYIRQKHVLKRSVSWRDCRKMVIQLVLISTIYFIFDLPYVFIFIIEKSGYTNFGDNIIILFIARLTLVPGFILPYGILLSLPDLNQKFRALCFWKRQRQIITTINLNR